MTLFLKLKQLLVEIWNKKLFKSNRSKKTKIYRQIVLLEGSFNGVYRRMGRIYAEIMVAFLFSAAVSMTVLCFKEQERIHRRVF